MKLIGNRYRIKSLIGEGGMASIYSAIDEKLDRRVAIKILHAHLSNNQDIRQRFHFEAKSIADIDHPNIIKVYDFSGNDSEQLWIVTEILYGVDLSEYVNKFPGSRLDPPIAVIISRQICNALEEVHNHGIVHRDIKPENIMVLDTGIIKLMDFGIAKVARNQNATQTGTFMGSPSYMSPEQIKGAHVDIRTDIYSLCVLMYEILTGTLPFVGNNTVDVINKIMQGKYPQPAEVVPEIPQAINKIIVKGMVGNRDNRYPSIMSFAIDLDKFLARYGIRDSVSALKKFFKNPKNFFKKLERAGFSSSSSRKTHEYPEGKAPVPRVPGHPRDEVPPPSRSSSRSQPPSWEKPDSSSQSRSHLHHRRTDPNRRTTSSTKHRTRSSTQYNRNKSSKTRYKVTSQKDSERILDSYLKKSSTGVILRRIFIAACLLGGLGFLGLRFFAPQYADRIVERDIQPTSRSRAKPQPSRTTTKADKRPTLTNKRNTGKRTEVKRVTRASKMDKFEDTRKNQPRSPNPPLLSAKTPKRETKKVLPNKLDTRTPPQGNDATADAMASKIIDTILPKKPPPENDTSPGSILIKSSPASDIYINGKFHFASNDPSVRRKGIILNPGIYDITLKRRGYKDFNKRVELKPKQILNLDFMLERNLNQVKLQIQTNRIPGQLIIKETSGGNNFQLNRAIISLNTSLELDPGTYQVIVQHTNKKLERTINLESNNEPYIIDAQFK